MPQKVDLAAASAIAFRGTICFDQKTVISALLERGYSDDPLGLFMGVSAGGLVAWLVIFAIWKIASGPFRPPT